MTDTISRILVPVDFSPHAERALCYATTLAYRLSASVTLLHLVENPIVTRAWGPEVYVPNVIDLLDDLTAAAARRLPRSRDRP